MLDVKLMWMKRLVWTYFILWIFEGALRKWVLPSFSDILLLLRDPIVLALYTIAWAKGIFPRNKWLFAVGFFSVLCLLVGFLVLPEGPAVVLYGYRSDFFSLPLIFLLPKVLGRKDLHRIGYVILLMATPQAMLMVAQFSAPANSWLNTSAGGESTQIGVALGHIRPPGTFSYSLAAGEFFLIVIAFLFYNQLVQPRIYPAWLIVCGYLGLISAAVVSGSRTFILEVLFLLVAGTLIASVLQPAFRFRSLQSLVLLILAGCICSYLPFFSDGVQTFATRLEQTGDTSDAGQSTLQRFGKYITAPVDQWGKTPIFGYGLGAASNVGTKLLGIKTLSLGEAEWDRIMSELGPILGVVFLLFRLSLLYILFLNAMSALRRRRDPLCIFLLLAVLPDFAMGSWGLSSTLGYAVFVAGCAFAGGGNTLEEKPARQIPFRNAVQFATTKLP